MAEPTAMETGDGAEGASKDPLLALDTGAYVIDLSNEIVDRSIEALAAYHKFLQEHRPDCVDSAAIDKGVQRLQSAYQGRLTEALVRFEAFARDHICAVPAVLREPEPASGPEVSAEEEAELHAELVSLRAQIVAARDARMAMETQASTLELELRQNEGALGELQKLQEARTADPSAPSAARALAAAATAMLPLLERAGVLRGAVPDRMLGDEVVKAQAESSRREAATGISAEMAQHQNGRLHAKGGAR